MRLKSLEISGFKSFGKTVRLVLDKPITGVVGPNGSGKSNVVEAIRFALGEQSIKSLRGGAATDMLFKPGNGGRGAVTASVTLIFDNHDRVFSLTNTDMTLSYDEIVIKREIDSEGVQKYSINGSAVRMRDIVELIASVNIGSSGHHIISQGEADRFLFSSSKERKTLLEEALGLKMYHTKIIDTERKLQKSTESLREAGILAKELEPHLKFLQRQVQKINEAEGVRIQLADLWGQYSHEAESIGQGWRSWVSVDIARIDTELSGQTKARDVAAAELRSIESIPAQSEAIESVTGFERLSQKESEYTRQIARVEYERDQVGNTIKKLTNTLAHIQKQPERPTHIPVSLFDSCIERLELATLKLQNINEPAQIGSAIQAITIILAEYKSQCNPRVDTEEINRVEVQLAELTSSLNTLNTAHADLIESIQQIQQEKQAYLQKRQQHEAQKLTALSRKYEVERNIQSLESELRMLSSERQHRIESLHDCDAFFATYTGESEEMNTLVGDMLTNTVADPVSIDIHSKSELDAQIRTHTQSYRAIERLKIRLEELGVISAPEVLSEYDSTKSRYEFITKEISDSQSAIAGMQPLLAELRTTVQTEFAKGIALVNEEFSKFFIAMFGGGSASVVVTEIAKRKKKSDDSSDVLDTETNSEDGDIEQGVDIIVKIPNKKGGDLSILSGGERSLTSIALLFALSQVNPPPFIVLDETDAALDESNSRKYGQLIQQLSALSQILVVTHNRETMSHCNVLYGVTLGQDAASQVFGVKFAEAVQYAK
jgi:chromosome segregation protein